MIEEKFYWDELMEKVRIPSDRLKPAEVRGLVLALVTRARKTYRPEYGLRDHFISQEVLRGIKPYGGYFIPQELGREIID